MSNIKFRKLCFYIILVMSTRHGLAQKEMKYTCTNIDHTPVYLNVTTSTEPMDYLGQSFYIYRYDLMIGSARYHSFYTYKFNKRLYLLDEDSKSINYTKDQILFDLNIENQTIDKAYGIFTDVDLVLDDKLKLNNKEFYFYSSSAIVFSYFSVTKMIFDEELSINQMEIKSYLGSTKCVMDDIIIEPIYKAKTNSSFTPNSDKKKRIVQEGKNIQIQPTWDKK